jgi:hypothetical protein
MPDWGIGLFINRSVQRQQSSHLLGLSVRASRQSDPRRGGAHHVKQRLLSYLRVGVDPLISNQPL